VCCCVQKKQQRIYDNWIRLVKGVRIIERIRKKFDSEEVYDCTGLLLYHRSTVVS